MTNIPRRRAAHQRVAEGGNYFARPNTSLNFVSSGSKLLDLALGGGWAEGRIGNVVGDKSSGKTLLMIEAAANFAIKYPKGTIIYREAEAAFDRSYADALGMPIDRVDFGDKDQPLETVEDLFEDLEHYAKIAKHPTLFICDSLDALSDRAELERDIDQATYGAEKAKKMSQLFRRTVKQMSSSRLTLLIVSQVRSKIGITFGGRTTTRSGGRALDFYASQVLFLSQIGTISRTISNIKRPVGISIKAKVDKNKVGLPFREAAFSITFGYGIDDLLACLQWLQETKFLPDVGMQNNAKKEELKAFVRELSNKPQAEYQSEARRIQSAVEKRWYEIELKFLPARRKYGD